jgi:trehalose/maltose hydrolase-like predicted phosphorylase
MLPTLLVFDPAAARGALQYRADRLGAAVQNARLWGNSGAQFPWESAFTGTEVAQNGGNAQHEIHISGDVALAIWQYFVLSGDVGWLASTGYPVLRGVAEFYASRAEQDGDGTYHIRHVEGSDEGQGDVSDSAWVNALASFSLRVATTYAARAGAVSAPANWSVIGAGLHASIPFDSVGNKHFPYARARARTHTSPCAPQIRPQIRKLLFAP